MLAILCNAVVITRRDNRLYVVEIDNNYVAINVRPYPPSMEKVEILICHVTKFLYLRRTYTEVYTIY